MRKQKWSLSIYNSAAAFGKSAYMGFEFKAVKDGDPVDQMVK